MKRKLRYILSLFALFAALALPLQVNAQEIGTGDTASYCNVSFVITDETETGYPGASITLSMTDVTGTITDSYTLMAAGSWLNENIPIYTMTAPTTYNVEAEMEEGYVLVNTADHSTDLKFAATSEGEITLEWSIVSTATIALETEETEASEETSNTNTYTIKTEDVSDEDALALFTNLMTAIVNYQEYDQEGWDYLMEKFDNRYIQGDGSLVDFTEVYVKCTDGTSEEWLAMDTLEQFLWLNTYLAVQRHVQDGNLTNLMNNFYIYTMTQIDVYDEWLRLYGPMEGDTAENLQTHIDELTGAMEDLLWWQYSHLNSKGLVYNFMEDETCIQVYTRMLAGEEVILPNQNEESEPEEEVIETPEEEEETETEVVEETTNKKGIWSGVIDAVMSNLIPILIACVMGIVLFALVQGRKKRNITNEDEHSGAESTLDK